VRAGARSARCRIPASVQFSVPWFDWVYLEILQLKCTKWWIGKL
jgi:hypothetical protein